MMKAIFFAAAACLAVLAPSAAQPASAAVVRNARAPIAGVALNARAPGFDAATRSQVFGYLPASHDSARSALTRRRAASPPPADSGSEDSSLVFCSSNTECRAIDKNAVCSRNEGTCQCKNGYYFDQAKNACAKATQAKCNAWCKKNVDPHTLCADYLTGDCRCDVDHMWVLNDTEDGCMKYTLEVCNSDCQEQYGAGAKCDPNDFSQCQFS